MEIKVDGRLLVSTLCERFKEEFGGTLRVYQGQKRLTGSEKVSEIATKTGSYECRGSKTVGGFEKDMMTTSISGFAELIKTGFVKEEDIPRFGERIYDEAQRLIVLVEDILKLSQLDEGKYDGKTERVDLRLLCEDVIFTLEAIAKKSEISLELVGEHVFVEGVQQILSEIVYNLCDNAIKYNRRNGAVRIRSYEEDGRPAVSVTDTGIGIPAEDLDRIFERFFRVNKSHSKEIGGTGLGLSIVKHGAAYHNAEIRVDSRLGEGTCITVVF